LPAPQLCAFFPTIPGYDKPEYLSGAQAAHVTHRPSLRHIVFFSARDKADIPAIVEGLSLLGQIPHSAYFEVRRNTQNDALSSEVDVVVYAEFDSAEAMAAYKSDPIYQRSIDIVRPLRDLRIAADI
jgi:hypothetical protein